MIKHRTSKFSRTVILLVGLCLIGTAFHAHQLHPDYEIQKYSLDHLDVAQPDCLACLNVVQATPTLSQTGNSLHLIISNLPITSDSEHRFSSDTDLNNKSPPLITTLPSLHFLFKKYL